MGCQESIDVPQDPVAPKRSYLLSIPSTYDGSTAVPLVLVFHGYGSSSLTMEKVTGFDAKAEAENFIVAYLLGAGDKPTWNDGITPETSGADDIQFIRDLIAKLESQYKIDSARIYATGWSNGGAMVHHIATMMADKIAAVAPFAGAVGLSPAPDGSDPFRYLTAPLKPISILILHQRTDTHIPYEGGYTNGGGCNQLSFVASPTRDLDPNVIDSLSFWLKANNCSGPPQHNTQGTMETAHYCDCHGCTHNITGFPVDIIDFQNCGGSDIEVQHIALIGGDHDWPRDKVCNTPPQVTTPDLSCTNSCTAPGPCNTFSATDAIWDFFQRHTLGH
jgi:Poly(3-hydroxybutyrate) depolymerase